MEKIYNGNEKIIRIIRANKITETNFRLSNFVYLFCENGRYIITNIMTGETYILTENEYNVIRKFINSDISYECIKKDYLKTLVYNRFIVEHDYNETENYKSVLQITKLMSAREKGIKSYTILPTTGCNARCVYCYEKDQKIISMTEETADKVIEYITETRQNGVITLDWFGGEPLIGRKTISYICSELKKRNIEFKSRMISNGSLFDENIVNEATNEWKLYKIQISLDGDKQDYELKKNYIDPQKYNYDKVIKNIKLLALKGIEITLSCNYDSKNFDSLKPLVDDLAEKLQGFSNIKIRFHILYQEKDSDNYRKLLKDINEVYDYAKRKGFSPPRKGLQGLRTSVCMASDIESNVLISPDGLLYNCEHMPENGTWGNIFEGITDHKRYEELKAIKPIEKECMHCCFLPLCSPFVRKGCPIVSKKYCYDVWKEYVDRIFRGLINKELQNGEINN